MDRIYGLSGLTEDFLFVLSQTLSFSEGCIILTNLNGDEGLIVRLFENPNMLMDKH